MLSLIRHIINISARRDRSEINAAMLDAVSDLFAPRQVTIYRRYGSKRQTVLFCCAGESSAGRFNRNAYLPDRAFCFPLEHDALLSKCVREKSAVMDTLDEHSHRIIFPVDTQENPNYLIDLVLSDSFSADQRAALMGLIDYFSNHVGLLDYAETDTLTGLANRKTFEKHLFELLGQAAKDEHCGQDKAKKRRRGTTSGNHWIAVCDIDHFKRINDLHGHLIGDEVLIMVAQIMREVFRFDDQLFRFGGEEFVALLQPADPASALGVLERFRRTIEKQVFSRVGHVTLSIGFSQLHPNDTPTDAIDRADEALYFAKRNGRNQVANHEALIANGDIARKEVQRGEMEMF